MINAQLLHRIFLAVQSFGLDWFVQFLSKKYLDWQPKSSNIIKYLIHLLTGSPVAQPVSIQQATALAITAIDILCKPDLLKDIQQQFTQDIVKYTKSKPSKI